LVGVDIDMTVRCISNAIDNVLGTGTSDIPHYLPGGVLEAMAHKQKEERLRDRRKRAEADAVKIASLLVQVAAEIRRIVR
jgi:hypothetical protein